MMSVMAAMFHFIRKLNDSGTLDYKNAIGEIGEVYLPIGAKRSKVGKAQVQVQGSTRELDCLTDETITLPTGTVIQVVDVTRNGILIVKKLNQ